MKKTKPLLSAVALLSISLLSYSFNVTAQETDATAPAAGEKVARAVFTSDVQGREPTDTITSLSNDKNKIYFFSDLRGLGGQVVTHRWEYQGRNMGDVKFNVGGPRWRVWSSKTLLPQLTGEWRVLVIDGNGNTVGEASFNYTAGSQDAGDAK